MNDFLDKKVSSIKEILTPTPFDGLSLIGGDSSKLGSENLPYHQKQKILRHLRDLDGDFLILDLGGNSSYNVLVFFFLPINRSWSADLSRRQFWTATVL